MSKKNFEISSVPADWSYWKFVQLYIGEEPIFRGETAEYSSHASILEKVLNEFGVTFERFSDPLRKGSPYPTGDGYKTVGMGLLEMSVEDNACFLLFGSSTIYNLTPNEEHLKNIQHYVPDKKFFIKY